jgi:hypothetical protein
MRHPKGENPARVVFFELPEHLLGAQTEHPVL